jgi:hypothetical protein
MRLASGTLSILVFNLIVPCLRFIGSFPCMCDRSALSAMQSKSCRRNNFLHGNIGVT